MNMLSSEVRGLQWLKWIFNIFIPDLVSSVSLCAFSVTLSVSSYFLLHRETQRGHREPQRATEYYMHNVDLLFNFQLLKVFLKSNKK